MKDEKFEYKYSPEQKDEIKKIKEKYLKEEKKVKEKTVYEKIKELDRQPEKIACISSLIIGIFSSLILGSGMSLIMIVNDMTLGLIVGIVGLIGVLFSYPIYKFIIKIVRNNIKDKIIKLCNEEML